MLNEKYLNEADTTVMKCGHFVMNQFISLIAVCPAMQKKMENLCYKTEITKQTTAVMIGAIQIVLSQLVFIFGLIFLIINNVEIGAEKISAVLFLHTTSTQAGLQ